MARRSWLRLVPSLLTAALLLLGVLGAPAADAVIRRRTITPEVDTGLPIRTDGRHVSVTGPMACDPGDSWEVQATLTQGRVRGTGRSEGACRGDIQEWVGRVAGATAATFEPGAARGCAVLRTLRDDVQTDRHQWCNDVVLAAAGAESDGGDDGDAVVSWVALAVGGLAGLVAAVALVRPRRAR